MSPENNQLPRELTAEEMQMPDYRTNAMGEVRNQFKQEAAPALEAVRKQMELRRKQVDYLRRQMDTFQQKLEIIKEGLELFKDEGIGANYELQKKLVEADIQSLEEQIAGLEVDRQKVEETERQIGYQVLEKGDRVQEQRDITVALQDLRDEWEKERAAMQKRHGIRMSILAGTKDQGNQSVQAYADRVVQEINELNTRYGLAEKGLVDRLKALEPGSSEQYSSVSSAPALEIKPTSEGLDAGGGLPLPGQGRVEESVPLGEHSPEEQVLRDEAERLEQQAAGIPAVEAVVNEVEPPELPTVPDLSPTPLSESADGGLNMDNEGRVENPPPVNLPGPNDLTRMADEEAASQAVVTPEPNKYATEPVVAQFRSEVNIPESEEAQKAADERDTANRYLNELGVHLGGLSGQLVRRELVHFLRGPVDSGEEPRNVTDEQINWVAQNTLDTATRLGLQRNGGESAADYFQRIADIAERSHMSLVDKIREQIPDFRIRMPRFGASEEQRQAALEARIKDLKARLKDMNDKLLKGDFAQAYDANGILRSLSAEERANARRKLEAERDQLQKQLDALPKTEGQGGGVETEQAPKEPIGAKLYRWWNAIRNAPGDLSRRVYAEIDTRDYARKQAQEKERQDRDFQNRVQELQLRVQNFRTEAGGLADIKKADTEDKKRLLNNFIRIYNAVDLLLQNAEADGRAVPRIELPVLTTSPSGEVSVQTAFLDPDQSFDGRYEQMKREFRNSVGDMNLDALAQDAQDLGGSITLAKRRFL